MIDHPSIFFSFVLWILIGIATAYLANRRGRDPYVWFAIGMLLGVLGLLLLMLLPSYAKEESHEKTLELAQSSEKTLEIPELSQEEELISAVKPSPFWMRDWFFLDKMHQQQGPISFEALVKLWKESKIEDSSFIWSDGMESWSKIEEVPELKETLDAKK